MEDTNTVLQMARDEMIRNWERVHNGIGSFRTTATSILGASSMLTALLSAFQVFLGRPKSGWEGMYNVEMVIMLFLFCILVICCVWCLFPITTFGPIDESEENLRETYFVNSETEALRKEISSYINSVQLIRKKIILLNRLTRIACVLLPLVVILFMCMLVIPRA